MARRCVQGVRVDVKIYARRYAVDVQRVGIECAFQRTENTKVRKNQMRSKDVREDDEVCRWKGLDRDSYASLPDVL
jgi:hypothetical protein